MALLQALTSVIYDLTTYTWTAASVALKYYLIGICIYLYRGNGLTKKNFIEKIVNDSRLVLTGLVGVGAVLYILQIELTPVLRLFSELVALGYFGFLFWRY